MSNGARRLQSTRTIKSTRGTGGNTEAKARKMTLQGVAKGGKPKR